MSQYKVYFEYFPFLLEKLLLLFTQKVRNKCCSTVY